MACSVSRKSDATRNTSRREGHGEKERHPWSGENVGNPVRRKAGNKDLVRTQLGFLSEVDPAHGF